MRRLALLVLLALPLSFAPAHAEARSASATYLGGPGDVILLECPDPDCPAEYIGGAPFALDGDASAKVTITDDVNADAAAYYEVLDAGDNIVISGSICSPTTIDLTGGASLNIYIDEAFGPLDCGGARTFGVKGSINVDFS